MEIGEKYVFKIPNDLFIDPDGLNFNTSLYIKMQDYITNQIIDIYPPKYYYDEKLTYLELTPELLDFKNIFTIYISLSNGYQSLITQFQKTVYNINLNEPKYTLPLPSFPNL